MRLRYGLLYMCLSLPLSALAGYEEGVAAYRLGDYSTALAELRPLAEQGNADAQWTVGLMYAQGSGVLQDYVQAHKWLNLAAARGHREAAATRESIARRMTSDQIAEAQRLARAFVPSRSDTAATAASGASGQSLPALPAYRPAPEPTTRQTVQRLQALLGERGYDAGPADGVMGRRTRNAIRAYQSDHGLAVDGAPSATLLAHVESNPANVKPGSWADTARAPTPTPAPASPAAPAPPRDDAQLAALVVELRALIRDGEARRTADRAFLRSLSDLVSRYDDPWARLVLEERFTSAADAKRSGWRVASGEFEVIGQGLRSRVELPAAAEPRQRSAEEQALALLGAIVGQAGGDNARYSAAQTTPEAEVYLPLAFGEAFRLELTVRSASAPAHLEVGLYQGTARTQGYALAYRNGVSGAASGVELSRRTTYGSNVVSQRSGVSALEDGSEHIFVWSREADGDMQVSLDGQVLVEVREQGVAGDFDGLRLRNLGGDFTVRSVTLRTGG